MTRLMVLPAKNVHEIRVIQIPEDFEEHEAYRHVVGLIAQVEEYAPDYCWDDIVAVLEDHQFHPVDFILGPHLD
jgi:hypothetical protein